MSPDVADRTPPLLRSRLFWRLYAGYVVLILVVTLVVGVLVERRVRADLLRDLRGTLHAQAFLLREIALPALEQDGNGDLQARIQSVAGDDPMRLTVLRADGRVIADSRDDPRAMDDHSARPEIAAARADGLGSSTRFSRTIGADLLYVAVRVPPAGDVLGYARTAYPLAFIEARVAELRGVVLFGAGLAALVGLAIGYVFARRFTAPLADVTRAVDTMASGGYGHVESDDFRGEIGRLARAFNSMSDELHQRMEIINADRNKVLAILASMVEGVIAVDGDEHIVHMNAVAGRMLSTDPEAAVGKRIREVTRVPEIPRILERTQSVEAVKGEMRLGSDNADPRTLQLAASPLRDAAGQRAGAVVVLHDVSELRRLEQVRRDFVANVSHELKTPLTAIRGMVETMLDDREMDPETGRRFTARIAEQSRRLTTLVTDLLTLARIEAAEDRGDHGTVDLCAPVRDCVTRIDPLCQGKNIDLRVELPDEPVQLLADEEDLRQIVGNLLDNAIKYTPEGGRVTLRVTPEDGRVHVEVEDTGIGIEPAHQERVFERFYRVDKARSRELGGTGLGLAIVKHLVHSTGGTISLKSTPGHGTVFRVDLPLRRA